MSTVLRFSCFIGILIVLLAGCTYKAENESLLARKLTWFSYLNGDDLRARCSPGAPDMLRLVYNAVYVEQVRTYDIETAVSHDPTQRNRMDIRVIGPANLSLLVTDEKNSLLAPWRGAASSIWLRDADMSRLWQSLSASNAFGPAPQGLQASGEDFFWIISVCRAGSFHFNAYKWPSEQFDAIQFDDLLFAWDMSDIAVNRPRVTSGFGIYGDSDTARRKSGKLNLSIGHNGLKGFKADNGN